MTLPHFSVSAAMKASNSSGVLPAGKVPMASSLARIIKSDETRAKLEAMGTFPAGSTPEAFDAFIAAETAKWAQVIKTAGVKPD